MGTTKQASRDPLVTGVRMVINGRPQGATLSKLSNVAYFHTKRIGGVRVERITTTELVALLKKAGVADPYKPGWKATLPNGTELAAVRGDTKTKPAPAKKRTAKPAKKRPAKKVATNGARATAAPTKLAPDNRARKPARR